MGGVPTEYLVAHVLNWTGLGCGNITLALTSISSQPHLKIKLLNKLDLYLRPIMAYDFEVTNKQNKSPMDKVHEDINQTKNYCAVYQWGKGFNN